MAAPTGRYFPPLGIQRQCHETNSPSQDHTKTGNVAASLFPGTQNGRHKHFSLSHLPPPSPLHPQTHPMCICHLLTFYIKKKENELERGNIFGTNQKSMLAVKQRHWETGSFIVECQSQSQTCGLYLTGRQRGIFNEMHLALLTGNPLKVTSHKTSRGEGIAHHGQKYWRQSVEKEAEALENDA